MAQAKPLLRRTSKPTPTTHLDRQYYRERFPLSPKMVALRRRLDQAKSASRRVALQKQMREMRDPYKHLQNLNVNISWHDRRALYSVMRKLDPTQLRRFEKFISTFPLGTFSPTASGLSETQIERLAHQYMERVKAIDILFGFSAVVKLPPGEVEKCLEVSDIKAHKLGVIRQYFLNGILHIDPARIHPNAMRLIENSSVLTRAAQYMRDYSGTPAFSNAYREVWRQYAQGGERFVKRRKFAHARHVLPANVASFVMHMDRLLGEVHSHAVPVRDLYSLYEQKLQDYRAHLRDAKVAEWRAGAAVDNQQLVARLASLGRSALLLALRMGTYRIPGQGPDQKRYMSQMAAQAADLPLPDLLRLLKIPQIRTVRRLFAR